MSWDKAMWTADEVLGGVPDIAVSTDLQRITGILNMPIPNAGYTNVANYHVVEGSGYFFTSGPPGASAYMFYYIDDGPEMRMQVQSNSPLIPFKERVRFSLTGDNYYQWITFFFTDRGGIA